MSEGTTETESIRRTRGKGFPILALDEAVDAIQRAGRYGRVHSLDDFAGLLGHETSNSGPFRRKLAALKDWGLIERSASRVVFTELANRIAHPSSEAEADDAVREAFFQEAMFSRIYEEAAKGVDLSLEFLGGRAVNALGVSPKSKGKFGRSFGKSVHAAGLGELTGRGQVKLFHPERQEVSSDATERIDDQSRPPASLTDTGATRAPTLRQEWPVDNGLLIFEARLEEALPAEAFSHVAEIATAVERLVGVLAPTSHDEAEHK
jgi:hypothetical protein